MDYRVGTCQSCQAQFQIPASFSAARARCKQCRGVVVIAAPVHRSAEEENAPARAPAAAAEAPPPAPRQRRTAPKPAPAPAQRRSPALPLALAAAAVLAALGILW